MTTSFPLELYGIKDGDVVLFGMPVTDFLRLAAAVKRAKLAQEDLEFRMADAGLYVAPSATGSGTYCIQTVCDSNVERFEVFSSPCFMPSESFDDSEEAVEHCQRHERACVLAMPLEKFA